MDTISGGSWYTIGDGCPIRATASGSDEGCLVFGHSGQHELTFSRAALRDFVAKGQAVLTQMNAMAAGEACDARSA